MLPGVPSAIEVLEFRWAPAQLVAGPLPPQFGVDLTSLPVEPIQIENLEQAGLVRQMAAPLDPGAVLLWIQGAEGTTGGTLRMSGTGMEDLISARLGLSGGMVKIGAGTLTLAGTYNGVFDSSYSGGVPVIGGSLSLGVDPGRLAVVEPPELNLTSGVTLNGAGIELAGRLVFDGSLVLNSSLVSLGSYSFVAASSLTTSGSVTLSLTGNQLVLGNYLSDTSLLKIAETVSLIDPTVLITALRANTGTVVVQDGELVPDLNAEASPSGAEAVPPVNLAEPSL